MVEKTVRNLRQYAEIASTPSPTSLDLFGALRGQDLESIRRTALAYDEQKLTYSRLLNSFNKYSLEIDKRSVRLAEVGKDIIEDLELIKSSNTCNEAYLKMSEEFGSKGYSPDEILRLFDYFLKLSAKFSKSQEDLGRERSQMLSIERGKKGKRYPMYQSEHDNPPKWFSRSRQEWQQIFFDYMNLYIYVLDPDDRKARKPADIKRKDLGVVVDDGFPDWYLDAQDKVPSLGEVRTELTEDSIIYNRLTNQQESIDQQLLALKNIKEQKRQKAETRLPEAVSLDLITTFYDLLLYLNLTDIYSSSAVEIIDWCHRKLDISDSREAVALWLESKLRESKIIIDVHDSVDQSHVDILNTCLNAIEMEDPDSTWEDLKKQSKKISQILKYDITPLLTFLTLEERSYLKDLIEDCKGTPISVFIWEMAEAISSYTKLLKDGDMLPYKSVNVLNHTAVFINKWLKKNWQWAYNQLRLRLLREDRQNVEEMQLDLSQEIDVTSQPSDQLIDEEISTTEEEIRQMQQGNLGGWRLYYSRHKEPDDDSNDEIIGETLQERTEAFKQFVGSHSISCSIKPQSVINALDWFITLPREAQFFRDGKNIKQVKWEKLRRGAVRGFVRVDKDKKEIILYIHQKKAHRYGF